MKTTPTLFLRYSALFGVALSTLSTIGAAQSRFPTTPSDLPAESAKIRRSEETKRKTSSVFQYSTLPALSLGLYDGGLTFGEVLQHGNFGLGTVNGLDGEVIILDGKAWQVRSNGQVSILGSRVLTPFAVVTHFDADIVRPVFQPTEYAAIKSTLDKLLPTPNAPYAISIRGTFTRMKTRSVPAQSKPYRPLAEVTKTQAVFEMQNVRGTLVGFHFPSYLSNVNLADYHFHFLCDDKTRGGHLLDCQLAIGEIKVQTLRNFELLLPYDDAFDSADLSSDQSAALQKAETGK